MVGKLAAMREIFGLLERIAPTRRDACSIEGETGTGKDVLARTLHAAVAGARTGRSSSSTAARSLAR